MTDYTSMKGWDLDLKFGKFFEQLIDDIFSGKYKAEVKTEDTKWLGYRNMVIETAYKGSPSGLSTTQGDVWVHNFSVKGELIFSLLIPTDILRNVVEKMEDDGTSRSTKGGDGWKSHLELLPLDQIMTYLIAEGHHVNR